jgi:hypothetical protein
VGPGRDGAPGLDLHHRAPGDGREWATEDAAIRVHGRAFGGGRLGEQGRVEPMLGPVRAHDPGADLGPGAGPVPVLADLLEVAGEGVGVEDALDEDGAPELATVGLDGERGGVEEDLCGGGLALCTLGDPGEEVRGGPGEGLGR